MLHCLLDRKPSALRQIDRGGARAAVAIPRINAGTEWTVKTRRQLSTRPYPTAQRAHDRDGGGYRHDVI